jgi:hypothetical protein
MYRTRLEHCYSAKAFSKFLSKTNRMENPATAMRVQLRHLLRLSSVCLSSLIPRHIAFKLQRGIHLVINICIDWHTFSSASRKDLSSDSSSNVLATVKGGTSPDLDLFPKASLICFDVISTYMKVESVQSTM